MAARGTTRTQNRRNALRAAGLRPIEIWIPDTWRPGFDKECRHQARIVAAADKADRMLGNFLDQALTEL
ncbi:antitoxin MazE family protein [Bosea thiooxidans]